mgnify:CR=1 FL=1
MRNDYISIIIQRYSIRTGTGELYEMTCSQSGVIKFDAPYRAGARHCNV